MSAAMLASLLSLLPAVASALTVASSTHTLQPRRAIVVLANIEDPAPAPNSPFIELDSTLEGKVVVMPRAAVEESQVKLRLQRLKDRRNARAWNGGLLTVILLTALYCVLQNDVGALISLYTTPDWAIPEVASSRTEIVETVLLRLPGDWIRWYDASALSRPILTKACTSGVCYAAGDLVAQATTGATLASLDLRRSARSAAAGFIGHGPVAHYWLQFVDEQMSFGGAWWAFVPKIIVDQGPMSIVYNTVYTVLIGTFALRAPRDIIGDVRQTWWPGMQASIKFWPLVHLVTFSPLVPLELKLLWVDAVEIVWVAILARVNAREAERDQLAAQA